MGKKVTGRDYVFHKARVLADLPGIYNDESLSDQEKHAKAKELDRKLKETHQEAYGRPGGGI